jgi:hypothetical protein
MTADLVKRTAVLLLLGVSLSACAGLGTVVDESDPETEVPNVSMGRSIMEGLGAVPSRRTPINYSPRAPLVIPKETAALAQPEDPRAVTAQANWPVDPDVEAARLMREADQRQLSRGDNELVPASELLATRTPPRPRKIVNSWDDPGKPLMPSELRKGPTSLAVNPIYTETGQPVRRALTDPPVTYLEPAPGAPVVIPEEQPSAEGKGLFSWLPW